MINAARAPLQPGESLLQGKYRIDAVIYSGAYTSLYRTTFTPVQPVRMLRVVQREPNENGKAIFSEYSRRFNTEAKLGQMFDHPGIIRVYGLDMDADTLVLVMEYAAGGSLADRLLTLAQMSKLMSVDDSIRVLREVAEGLAVIHAENIVHRNIKPDKILFDADGRAKLADLGLAQLPGEPITRLKLRQSRMAHPGTPAYMSPEQKTVSDYITPASDVYALGLILFEMLTGRVYRSVRPGMLASKLRAEVPAWLDQLLANMLDMNAQQRPWDASDVAKLLVEHASSSLPAPHVIGPETRASMPAAVTAPDLSGGAARADQPVRYTSRGSPVNQPHTPTFETTQDALLDGPKLPPQQQKPKRPTWLIVLIIVLLCGAMVAGAAYLTFMPR